MVAILNVRTARLYFFLVIGMFGGTYNGAYFLALLMENAEFLFILMACFLGVIRGIISAKANGKTVGYADLYSAFFAYVLLSIAIGSGYYVQKWNVLWLAFGGALVGAMVNSIINKLLAQVDEPPDFMALLGLFRRIAIAIWEVINSSKGNQKKE